MAQGAIPTLNNATYGSSTFPLAAEHFWNLDPASQIVMLGRQSAPLFYMMTMGLGIPKDSVNDKVYKTLNEHPMITDFLIQGDNGAGSAAALTTTTAYISMTDPTATISDARKMVRVGDQILVHPRQTNQTTAAATVAAAGEVMEVLAVAADGSFVQVARNRGSSATTANVAAGSGNTLYAELLPAAMGEKERSRDSLAHAFIEQDNYCQKFQEPFEVANDVENTLLVGGSKLAREQRQKLNKFLRDIEFAMLFGKKRLDVSGSDAKYSTQGFVPFIVGDTTTYAAYTAANDLVTGNAQSRMWNIGSKDQINLHNWLTLMERTYSEGSSNKVLVCGAGFYTALLQSLEGYITLPLTTNTGMNLGMDITSWRHGYGDGGMLKILQHQAFKGARYNDFVILDLDFCGYKVFRDKDVRIWKGNGGFGLQDNDADVTKYAWAATVGAHMTYGLAHAYGFGMLNDDGSLGGLNQTVGTLTPSNT